MKIAVILKKVPDTASLIKIGPDGKSFGLEGLKFIISPYDEHAVEQAILLKEAGGNSAEVVVVSAERARDCKKKPVWVLGSGEATTKIDAKGQATAVQVPDGGTSPGASVTSVTVTNGYAPDGGGGHELAPQGVVGRGDDEPKRALGEAGIAPLTLIAKEGLALINGTDGMLGMLLLALHDLRRLLRTADLSAAMSTEALLGTDRAFAGDLQELRPHPGQAISAANLRRLLAGSAIVASHRVGDSRVQDAYSLRCAPQVNGAARDTVAHAERVAAIELVSAIDNPMILPDGRVESCGNFHGAPLGFACDFLAIAAAEVGAIAERRTDRLLDANRSQGLPPFLAVDAGVNSGVMIAHYTQAAMVAENRRLAAPASVDSLPTSAMQEDHVSMGWGAARKLRRVLDNLSRILAVELLCAARGLELRAPLAPAAGTEAARALVESLAGGAGPDRWLAPELAAVERMVRSGEALVAAEVAVGPLA